LAWRRPSSSTSRSATGPGPLLERLKNWLAENNAVNMAVLMLIIGVKLIGDPITGLSS
jgi:hypothetical protein